jgi:hypothetical protein
VTGDLPRVTVFRPVPRDSGGGKFLAQFSIEAVQVLRDGFRAITRVFITDFGRWCSPSRLA